MPRPVYIICSQSASQDSETNLVSHFNVIERMELQRLPTPKTINQNETPVILLEAMSMRITAVWMRTHPDEAGKEFDVRMLVHLPDGSERELWNATVTLFNGSEILFHRVGLNLRGRPFSTDGIHRMECMVRQVDCDEWITQDYPFQVSIGDGVQDSSGD